MSIDDARSFLQQGRFADAISVADAALSFDATNVYARQWRSWAYQRLGRPSLALPDISSCIQRETRPERASILYAQRALVHVAMLDYALALHDAHRSVEHDQRSWFAFWIRSRMHCYAKDLPSALHDADRSIELSPDQPDVLLHRADICRRLGRIAQANADVNRALELEPANQLALLLSAALAVHEGDTVAGERRLQMSGRNDVTTLIQRVDVVDRPDSMADLVCSVDEALDQPDNSSHVQSIHRAMAMAHYRLRQPDQALHHAQQITRDDVDVHIVRARIHLDRNELRLALSIVDHAIEIEAPQRSVMLYFLRGKVQRRMKQPGPALASFRHAANLAPSSVGGRLAHRAAVLLEKELEAIIERKVQLDHQSNAAGWSVSRVQAWLRKGHLGLNVADRFEQFRVDGAALINLDEQDLIEIGITIRFQRRQILDLIDTIR